MEEGIARLRKFMPQASAALPEGMAMLACEVYFDTDPLLAQSMMEESIAIGRSSSDPAALASALYYASDFFAKRKDFSAAYASAAESLRLCRQHRYPAMAGMAIISQGSIAMRQGDQSAARAYFEESLPLLHEGEYLSAIYMVTGFLAGLDLNDGEFASARGRFAEASQISKDLGLKAGYYAARTLEVVAGLFQGDYDMDGSLLREGLPYLRKELCTYTVQIAFCLAGLAYLAACQGDRHHAGRLLGAADALAASLGERFERSLWAQHAYRRLVEMARSGFDPAAWEEGYQMTVDQAIDYVLQDEKVQ